MAMSDLYERCSFIENRNTRMGLTKREDPNLTDSIVCMQVDPIPQQEVSIVLILKRLEVIAHLLEGVLVVPTENEFQVSLLLVCRPPNTEGGLGSENPVSHILTSSLGGINTFSEDLKVKFSFMTWGDLLTDDPTCKDLLVVLEDALVHGGPLEEGYQWFAHKECVATSSPKKPYNPLEPLPIDNPKQTDPTSVEALAQLVLQLQEELAQLKARDMSNPNQSLADSFARSMKEHSEQLIKNLAESKVLAPPVTKLQSCFSGDKLKGDSSFETWEFEVKQLLDSQKESVVRQAIIKSLKGSALEALMSISPTLSEVPVLEILDQLRSKYGISSSYDAMMAKFFLHYQDDNENVSQFSTRIESLLRDIQYRFPRKIPTETVKLEILRERFYHGCKEAIRTSVMFKFKDPNCPYSELLSLAREVESNQESRNLVQIKSEKSEKKAQVKSEVASTITDPSLAKLIQVAKQCESEQTVTKASIKTLQNAYKDFEQRNNTLHVPYEERSNGQKAPQGQGYGRGGRSPNFNNPNPNYLGHNYNPNYRGRGGSSRGGRGGFRPDQSRNFEYYASTVSQNQSSSQSTSNPNQNRQQNGQNGQGNLLSSQNSGTTQRKQPFCKFCQDQKFPATDHWPNQCEFVSSLLANHRQNQRSNGHQNQSQNLNGSGLP